MGIVKIKLGKRNLKTPCAWGLSLLFTGKHCGPWERAVTCLPHAPLVASGWHRDPASTRSWDPRPTCRVRQEPVLPSSCQAANPAGSSGVLGDGVQGKGCKLLYTHPDSAWKCPGDGWSPQEVLSSLWSCSGHRQKGLSPLQDSAREVRNLLRDTVQGDLKLGI